MLAQKPPIRMIAPGAVFRRDFDITHTTVCFIKLKALWLEVKGKRLALQI
ncbi:hypothetical protein JNW89_33055 [Micromonospora sp. 4G55]|nr:hypothetical protein [Micromonospora sp. 4G55]